MVCLDITPEAIETAVAAGAALIVSHHAVIYKPVSRMNGLPYKLAGAGMAAIAVHTNLDKCDGGVNDILARRLGLTDITVAQDGLCRIGTLPEGVDLPRLAEEKLGVTVRFSAGSKPVRRVAVGGGSCGEYLLKTAAQDPDIGAIVTGELKHPHWLECRARGIAAVDAGHHPTEAVVLEPLAAILREAFPAVVWSVFDGGNVWRVRS
ncbi:MAG: Nif3-like dinuclear metal center hexameric protein [Oscillospiraceae bacterium]|nr:Nif3-like dinuclear metal center hexameric protein [Oscillospiraceae bacterium]